MDEIWHFDEGSPLTYVPAILRDDERLGLLGPLGGLCDTLGMLVWLREPTLVVRGR